MMVEALRDPSKMDGWIGRVDTTIKSYGGDPSAIPQADVAWLDGLPLMHTDAHRIFVHAGVDPEVPLDARAEHTLLWKRYPKGYKGGFGDRHVVHGQLVRGRTGAVPRSHQPRHLAWRTGRLVTGVFDDAKPGGPVDSCGEGSSGIGLYAAIAKRAVPAFFRAGTFSFCRQLTASRWPRHIQQSEP